MNTIRYFALVASGPLFALLLLGGWELAARRGIIVGPLALVEKWGNRFAPKTDRERRQDAIASLIMLIVALILLWWSL